MSLYPLKLRSGTRHHAVSPIFGSSGWQPAVSPIVNRRIPVSSRATLVACLLPLLLLLLLFTGCGRPTTTQNRIPASLDIIAIVDGKPIPLSALESELNRAHLSGRPTDPQKTLEDLIQRERLVARALRLGLDHDPEVQRSIEALLVSRLKSLELEPKLRSLEVTDQDVQRIQDQDANLKKPRLSQVRLAMLRLGVNPKATPARLKETEARLEEARAKASQLPPETLGFGPLAIDYSDDDPTRYRGGDLGWLETDPARYHFDQAVLAAGFALTDPGEISPIIRGADAFYLVRFIDRRNAASAVTKPDNELVRHRALIEKRRALEAAFSEETKEMIPVTVNSSALATIKVGQPKSERNAEEAPEMWSPMLRHEVSLR